MRLRELRESKGLKQKVVAGMLGITRQTYADHEQRPWMMRQGEALAICDILGVSPEDVEDFRLPTEVN